MKMKDKTTLAILSLALGLAVYTQPTFAADGEIPPLNRKVTYSPYPAQNFPNRVFFGDTHLHTSYSTDAGSVAG